MSASKGGHYRCHQRTSASYKNCSQKARHWNLTQPFIPVNSSWNGLKQNYSGLLEDYNSLHNLKTQLNMAPATHFPPPPHRILASTTLRPEQQYQLCVNMVDIYD